MLNNVFQSVFSSHAVNTQSTSSPDAPNIQPTTSFVASNNQPSTSPYDVNLQPTASFHASNTQPTMSPIRDKSRLTRIELTTSEIYKVLCNISPNKASGPDNLPGRIFKEVTAEISTSQFFTSYGAFSIAMEIGKSESTF